MLKYVMTFTTLAMATAILSAMTNDFYITIVGSVAITALSFKFWKSFFKIIWTDYLEGRL